MSSGGAHVGSIDAVRYFRAVMNTFSHDAREALTTYDTEVQRTLDWLLEENGNQTSQVVGRDLFQIALVNFDVALIRVIKTTEQFDESALARAIWTNNSDYTTGGNYHIEAVERFSRSIGILKRHTVEPYSDVDVMWCYGVLWIGLWH